LECWRINAGMRAPASPPGKRQMRRPQKNAEGRTNIKGKLDEKIYRLPLTRPRGRRRKRRGKKKKGVKAHHTAPEVPTARRPKEGTRAKGRNANKKAKKT